MLKPIFSNKYFNNESIRGCEEELKLPLYRQWWQCLQWHEIHQQLDLCLEFLVEVPMFAIKIVLLEA